MKTDLAEDTLQLDANDSTGALVREAYVAVRDAFHEQLRSHGITSAQWVFLRVLWEHEGIIQKELSRVTHTHQTTVVSALSVMEKHGIVRRSRSEVDRREVHVFLTPKGRALQADLIPYARMINDRLLKDFSAEDRDMLKLLLRRMIANMKG